MKKGGGDSDGMARSVAESKFNSQAEVRVPGIWLGDGVRHCQPVWPKTRIKKNGPGAAFRSRWPLPGRLGAPRQDLPQAAGIRVPGPVLQAGPWQIGRRASSESLATDDETLRHQ